MNSKKRPFFAYCGAADFCDRAGDRLFCIREVRKGVRGQALSMRILLHVERD